jgi:hypothetical protein
MSPPFWAITTWPEHVLVHLVGGFAGDHTPGVIDLAGLNGLDSVKYGLCDVAQPRRSYGYGDIGALVADAVWVSMEAVSRHARKDKAPRTLTC